MMETQEGVGALGRQGRLAESSRKCRREPGGEVCYLGQMQGKARTAGRKGAPSPGCSQCEGKKEAHWPATYRSCFSSRLSWALQKQITSLLETLIWPKMK